MGWWNQPRDARGRWTKGKSGLVATAAVIGLGMAGGGFGGAAGTAGSTGSATGSVVRVKVDAGKSAARSGNRARTWERMGLRKLREHADRVTRCAAHSYGEVRGFFVRTPCRSLDRVLFLLRDESGTFVVSVSWVRMGSPSAAADLRRLADRDGTGNVSPVVMSLLEAVDVPFTGRYYDSRLAGPLVVIAEVEPVSGAPDPVFVDGVAGVAALLPPPRR